LIGSLTIDRKEGIKHVWSVDNTHTTKQMLRNKKASVCLSFHLNPPTHRPTTITQARSAHHLQASLLRPHAHTHTHTHTFRPQQSCTSLKSPHTNTHAHSEWQCVYCLSSHTHAAESKHKHTNPSTTNTHQIHPRRQHPARV